MESLFAQLYLALQQQIKTFVPAVKWIDLDIGQLEAYEERPAVQFPCVLIDFPAAQYSNNSDKVQWVDINVSVRLCFAPFGSTNQVTPDVTKQKALEYFEIEHKLHEALQGFTAGDCVQGLDRKTAAAELRDDTFRVRVLQYTTATEDDTVQNYHNTVAADLELNLQDIDAEIQNPDGNGEIDDPFDGGGVAINP